MGSKIVIKPWPLGRGTKEVAMMRKIGNQTYEYKGWKVYRNIVEPAGYGRAWIGIHPKREVKVAGKLGTTKKVKEKLDGHSRKEVAEQIDKIEG